MVSLDPTYYRYTIGSINPGVDLSSTVNEVQYRSVDLLNIHALNLGAPDVVVAVGESPEGLVG